MTFSPLLQPTGFQPVVVEFQHLIYHLCLLQIQSLKQTFHNSDRIPILKKLFDHSPQLARAYRLKNELTSIFDSDLPRRRAKQRITGWMNRVKLSSVRCFDSFLKTLTKNKDDIANYFVDRLNSGFVEGLNNKIKVIKRRCYGITNIGHLFQHIYLDLSGYSLYATQKS